MVGTKLLFYEETQCRQTRACSANTKFSRLGRGGDNDLRGGSAATEIIKSWLLNRTKIRPELTFPLTHTMPL
jgi:hypothetical protein